MSEQIFIRTDSGIVVLGTTIQTLHEKIQPPTSPKGRAAFAKSLGGWSKAASKVAGSYKDRLQQANPKEIEDHALLMADLAQASKLLAVIAERAERLKK